MAENSGFKYYARTFGKSDWMHAGILASTYIAAHVAARYLPLPIELHPEFVIALAALFFGGLRLWPFVFVSALLAGLIAHDSLLLMIFLPVIATVQAVVATALLKHWKVDPIFRRDVDVFYLISTICLISLIPTFFYAFEMSVAGVPFGPFAWLYTYVATFFCFIVIGPFILRWIAKPRFRRTWMEIIETAGIFAALIMIDAMLFLEHRQAIFGISLIYILLIPLFLMSLRQRPRFVTLALLITAFFSIAGLLVLPGDQRVTPEMVFGVELLISVLAINFLIITSLEEHRRLNTTRLYTQVATLENVVVRVKSESQAKNDFIAILAHELRNPLSPVVSGIEFLKIKGGRDSDDQRILESMSLSMGTVRTLLNDLLDVTRISEGKISLKKKRILLETVLRSAIDSTEHHRAELHQDLVYKKPHRPIFIFGDAVRIEQVFSNLLTNASKYSNSGDTITVKVHEKNDCVEIEVMDQGVGLDNGSLHNIFLPFHQLEHGERTKEGLGIGLSLVHDFVKMHDGTVRAESRGSGLGSSFIVRFPLAPKELA